MSGNDGAMRTRRATVVTKTALTLFGAVLIGIGCYLTWAQHSGIGAQVEVVECHGSGRHEVCNGQWQSTNGEPETVLIDGVTSSDVGSTLPMHVHGGRAYPSSLRVPLLFMGFGGFFLASLVWIEVSARRRARQAQSPLSAN